MSARRLGQGGEIDRSRALRFRFDGREFSGFAGDTVASALLAGGAQLLGRSFKYHRPRGLLGAGWEEPNAVLQIGSTEAAQIPNVRATQQALYSGLVASSTNGFSSGHRPTGART